MTRTRLLAIGLLLTGFLGLVPVSRPQKASTPVASRERERRSFAINLLRAINAAELDYKKKHGVYANWTTLLANGDFTETGTRWSSESYPTVAHALYGTGPEIVPGWRLRLNLSSNGNAYDVMLEDVTDPKCGYAAITDERGMVRQGKSVDCEP